MSKKIPLAAAIALIFVFSALTVIITVSVYMRSYTKALFGFSEQSKQFAKLTELELLIRDNYVGKIDPVLEDNATLKGYVAGLGDPNAAYYTADEYETFKKSQNGEEYGVGLQTSYNAAENVLVVTGVANGSPAMDAGIKTGDKICRIGKKEVSAANYAELQKILDTNSSDPISVSIVNVYDEDTEEPAESVFALNTGYHAASVYAAASSRVGYIRISNFYDDTPTAFQKALVELQGNGIAKLVIDVRNNKSSNYNEAALVIDQLVPVATEGNRAIAVARDVNGEIVKSYSSDTERIHIPVAVLMNDRTSGAGELLAADLRDFLSAKIIGERSAGNAGFPQTFMLEDGSALVLSVAKTYPCITDCYDGTGIIPDIEVVLPAFQKDLLEQLSLEDDAQYAAAVAALN